MVRRVRVPADFEATPDGMTTVNHELGTELLVKYSKVKKVINTDGRQACFHRNSVASSIIRVTGAVWAKTSESKHRAEESRHVLMQLRR